MLEISAALAGERLQHPVYRRWSAYSYVTPSLAHRRRGTGTIEMPLQRPRLQGPPN